MLMPNEPGPRRPLLQETIQEANVRAIKPSWILSSPRRGPQTRDLGPIRAEHSSLLRFPEPPQIALDQKFKRKEYMVEGYVHIKMHIRTHIGT